MDKLRCTLLPHPHIKIGVLRQADNKADNKPKLRTARTNNNIYMVRQDRFTTFTQDSMVTTGHR